MREWEFRLCADDVYRYLTRGGSGETDSRLLSDAQRVCDGVRAATTCRVAGREFAIDKQTDPPTLRGTQVRLDGDAIRLHLAQCESVYLFVATLGGQVDGMIERLQVRNLADAYLADTCASLAIEDLCEQVSARIAEQCAARQCSVTSRFSPGYGDFPLAAQGAILQAVQADKILGVRLTRGDMMMPSKTVSALIGIGRGRIEKSGRCLTCPRKDVCKESLCSD